VVGYSDTGGAGNSVPLTSLGRPTAFIENHTGTISFNTETFSYSNPYSLTIPTPVTGSGRNSGTVNFTTPSIDSEFDIPTNTGEINFTKDLDGTLAAAFIKSKANHGSINFWGTITTSDALGSTSADDSIAGNGEVTFGGLAEFAEDTIVGCDTVFEAGLTRSAAKILTLNGDVTLGYGQGISLTGATPLTLGADKRILIADTPVLALNLTHRI
jgi:hypothetical protein